MSENELKINRIIAKNLASLLRNKNRTQLELAEYLGVTQATVSNWCNGVKMPRMDKIDKICDFFDVKRSALMSASPELDEAERIDSLFIKKYGQDSFDLVAKYQILDQEDRIRINERVDMLLEDDKYKKGSSEEKAI